MNEAMQVVQNDLNVQEIRISGHALERFMSRYEKITGESLTIEQALAKIRQALAASVLETDEENPRVARRRERHGNSQYFVSSPWRFVLKGGDLITCEIFPEFFEQISNPKILPEQRRCRIYIVIEENPVENCTVMMKSWTDDVRKGFPWAVVQFPEIVEINAVIRVLRAVGIRVHYEKIRQGGEGEKKSCFLEIIIPKEIISFEIIELPNLPRIIKLVMGFDALLPMGQRYILSSGATKRRMEQAIDFISNEEWLKTMEELHGPAVQAVNLRCKFTDKMPVKQRLDAVGNLFCTFSPDNQSEIISGCLGWQGEGQLVFHGGEQTLNSGVCKARIKREVFRKICDDLWLQLTAEGAMLYSRFAAFHRLLRIRHIKPEEDENGFGENETAVV